MVVDFQILANDVDITKKIKLLGGFSLNISESISNQSDNFSLRISDAEGIITFPSSTTRFEVFLGYKDMLKSFGFFYVTDTKYTMSKGQGAFIDISASSVPFVETSIHKSMQTVKERTFSDTTVASIIEEIAAEHSLSTKISPVIGNQPVENISQHNESNIGFLYRLVREHGGTLKPTVNNIVVLSDTKALNIHGEEITKTSINMTEISDISYSCKKTAKFKSVEADYQDTDTATIKTVKVGSGDPVLKLSYMYESERQAKNIAEKAFNTSSTDNDSMSITTVGDPELISGGPIEIVGLRDDIPQNWYIKSSTHSLSKSGYTTSLELTLKS